MARWQQYEVWVQENEPVSPVKAARGKSPLDGAAGAGTGPKWQLVGSFMDLDVANAVARRRTRGVRLLRVTFEDSKRVQEEVLLEIGATRKAG